MEIYYGQEYDNFPFGLMVWLLKYLTLIYEFKSLHYRAYFVGKAVEFASLHMNVLQVEAAMMRF